VTWVHWACFDGKATNGKEDGIVKQTRERLGLGIVLVAGLLMGAGCGGTGKTFYLDLQQKQAVAQYQEPEPVSVVIEPFEDRRLENNWLGVRTHVWGGVTYFNVVGERPPLDGANGFRRGSVESERYGYRDQRAVARIFSRRQESILFDGGEHEQQDGDHCEESWRSEHDDQNG
jgi:hypothetical protein